MKQLYLLLFALVLGTNTNLNAQCTIDPQYTQPGLYPSPDSLDCLVGDGVFNDIAIQFVNFDQTSVGGFNVTVEYIIIDSIVNLPCGVKWTTNKECADTANKFVNSEKGCIRLWGNTNDAAGQYKLDVWVLAKVDFLPNPVVYKAEDLGFRVDIRLKATANDVCPALDTTNGATLLTSTCKNAYTAVCTTGVEVVDGLLNFSLYPNPTNAISIISFTAERSTTYNACILNIYGQEVSRWQLQVQQGTNTHPIDVSAFPPGVYFFTITDGKNTTSQRFVVE